MRVTKAVRSYIEKQVEIKVAKKYEWEKEESQRIFDMKEDFVERAKDAARRTIVEVLAEAEQHKDVLIYHRQEVDNVSINLGWVIVMADQQKDSSVHNWRRRMNKEIDEIVENIIVTLELGGNKADLDRMLAEL